MQQLAQRVTLGAKGRTSLKPSLASLPADRRPTPPAQARVHASRPQDVVVVPEAEPVQAAHRPWQHHAGKHACSAISRCSSFTEEAGVMYNAGNPLSASHLQRPTTPRPACTGCAHLGRQPEGRNRAPAGDLLNPAWSMSTTASLIPSPSGKTGVVRCLGFHIDLPVCDPQIGCDVFEPSLGMYPPSSAAGR